MVRTLLAILLAAAALPAAAATHTVYYSAASGGTYYAYPIGQSLADWTTYRSQLSPGSSPNASRYSGTLNDAHGLAWVVFSGASQPASWDAAVADIDLQTAVMPTTLLSTTTSDTGSGTLGRALHYLRLAWVSSGKFSTTALENAPSGGGGAADVDAIVERILAAREFKPNPQLTWVLRRGSDGVGSDQVKRKRAAEAVTFYFDARPLLADGEAVAPDSIEVTEAGSAQVSIDEESFDVLGSLIFAKVSGGDAGELTELKVTFETSLGQELEATVPLGIK